MDNELNKRGMKKTSKFTREDLDKKELLFKGEVFKIGLGSLRLSGLSGKFYSTKTTKDGKIYAFNKIDHRV